MEGLPVGTFLAALDRRTRLWKDCGTFCPFLIPSKPTARSDSTKVPDACKLLPIHPITTPIADMAFCNY